MEVPFGPWLPEQTDYKNPGLEVCTNAIPSPKGYKPRYSLMSTGASVTGDVLGARGFLRKDATPVVCVATTSDLFVIVSGSATASSLSLSLTQSSDKVVFEQYGAKVYATTKNGATWVLDDVESDTSFAAATGTPPKANAMGRVGKFVVMGDLEDIDSTDAPYRIRWSRFNDPDGTWGTDVATQSGAQELDSSQGPITHISGGTFGIIFQRNGISRLTYTGTKTVWALDNYEKERGCVAPRSALRVGDRVFFLSYDGFFETNGASTRAISRGKIWDWFVDYSNTSFIADVWGAVDWENRCCVWLIPGGADASFTGQLWYNWETESWSFVDQALDGIVAAGRSGLTLEQVAVLYPDLDTMDISLDSPVFRASGRTMLAFSGGDLQEFTGSTLAAEFQMGSMQPFTGQRSFIRGVTPIIENDGGNTTVSIGYRDTMTRGYTASPSVAIGGIGYAALNVDGRYFRPTIRVPAGEEWDNAYGAQLDVSPSGLT